MIPRSWSVWLLSSVLLAAVPVWAVDTVTLQLDVLEGAGIELRDVRASLRPGAGHHGLELTIGTVSAGDGLRLESVLLTCAQLRLEGLGGTCPRGEVRFVHPWLGAQVLAARFTYVHPGRLDLHLSDLRVAGGPVAVHLELDAGRWRVRADGHALDLEVLGRLFAEAGIPWPVDASGTGRFTLAARGRDAVLETLDVTARIRGGGFVGDAGLLAGEEIDGDIALSLNRERDDYRVDLSGRWQRGGVYAHPVFLEARGDAPLTLGLRGLFSLRHRALQLDALQLVHQDVITLAAQGTWAFGRGMPGLALRVDLERVDLPAAYEIYAQPFLPGTALDDLETRGLAAGRLHFDNGLPTEVVLNTVRVGVHDRRGRFALDGLDAALHWRAEGAAPPSRVAMDGGHVYGIAVGPVRFQPVIGRDGFHLPSPVSMPVLDGALEIRDLQVEGLGGATRWRFDGGLAPISMERLTGALGWPVLSGTLAGIIPDVRYEQGVLTVGGRLLVRAFDGSLTLGDLRLRDPLGVAPELSAQIQVRNLDLAELTRTFDVGRITGRLDGDVRDLVLVRWSPVQFDALVRTPPGDTSTRRISQRAVDSLTRVGGGVGGVLSGGFLRFFEDFSYRQLGLSCRLEGEVCHMDGIAPATVGYYIVQGAGLPRIDVIGYTRQVAWRDLVARLATVIGEGADPVIR